MEKVLKIGQVPLKIFIFISLNDLIDTTAQLLMKKGLGSTDLDSAQAFVRYLLDFNNPLILLFWTGLVIFISNFFLWMFILSKVDLSVALPLASISYIIVPLASMYFLHEHIDLLRWSGLFFIVIGIYVVSMSPSKTTAKP